MRICLIVCVVRLYILDNFWRPETAFLSVHYGLYKSPKKDMDAPFSLAFANSFLLMIRTGGGRVTRVAARGGSAACDALSQDDDDEDDDVAASEDAPTRSTMRKRESL